MASKSKQRSSKTSRDTSRNRTKNHVIVEDDVIVEEVVPEEEEYSQMNFLSGRDEVSSAKLQEIYDRKFAPPRPKSDSSLRGSGALTRTIDLTSARKSATAKGDAFVRRSGDKVEERKKEKLEEQVDEVEVEKIVKQMKAAKVYEYDAELGIRTIEPRSDDSEDDDSSDDDSNESSDEAQNQNENQGGAGGAGVAGAVSETAATTKKKKAGKIKKAKKPEVDDDGGDIDPLFGKRGKCPLQLLSEFIDAVTKKEYGSALNLCEMILIFEPTNEIALEFIPNLKEKIQIEEEQGSESEDSSDDSDDSDDESSESGDTDDDL